MAKQKINDLIQHLGCGYDVFDKYASVDSVKQKILNIDKLNNDGWIEINSIPTSRTLKFTGDSKESYSYKMSNESSLKLKISGFGGSVNTNFNTGRTKKLHTYFATYSHVVQRHNVNINSAAILINYLDENVKRILNNNSISADTIFGNYGHYVLVNASIGGRIDHNTLGSSDSSTGYEKFKIAVDASFGKMISVKTEHETSTEKSTDDLQTHLELIKYGGIHSVSIDQYSKDLPTWERTLEEHAIFVDFGATRGRALIPIWELVDTNYRADELRKRFIAISKDQKESLMPKESEIYITDIKFVSDIDQSRARQKVPGGYEVVQVDLNKGAKGDFIYLCYKRGPREHAYTDFFMEYTGKERTAVRNKMSHNSNHVDYTRISSDLNKGASGKYVYLFTTKAITKDPIKNIDAIIGKSVDLKPGWEVVTWQNSTDPADVNKDAKGEFVYIVYER